MDPDKFSEQFRRNEQEIYDWNEFARREKDPARRDRPLHNDPTILRNQASIDRRDDYSIHNEHEDHEDYDDYDDYRDPRQTAADWHGGMGSALYRYSSTGSIHPDALSEIDHLLARDPTAAQDPQEREHLTNLRGEIEGRLGREGY